VDDDRKAKVDVLFTNGGFTMTEGHPVPLYRRIHTQYRGRPADTFLETASESAFFQVDSIAELDDKWPRFLAQGSDLVKIYLLHSDQDDTAPESRTGALARGGLRPDVAEAVVRRAKAAGLPVIAHIESAADIRIALDAGVDALAHLPYNIRGSASAIAELRTISPELARRLAESGVAVITTATQGFRQLDMEPPLDDRPKRQELLEVNLRRMAEAEVQLLVGSDMNTPVPEAKALHANGPWNALEMLTIWTEETPRWMFPDRDIGRLVPGYEASVIGLSADPRDDFGAVDDVALAIKQGVVLERPGES
jgi:imidazolonepropionase-like amidohydrolase